MPESRRLDAHLLTDVLAEHFPERPRDVRYFDTAAVGLVPTAVRRATARCYTALARGTLGSPYLRSHVERAHELLAAEFGVAVAETAFASSTSDAVAGITRLIKWSHGDQILVTEGDFPSIVLPWYHAGHDVEVTRVAPLARDDRLTPLLEAIGPRTKVVAVSHVNSTTGTRLDLDALGRACHAADAMLVVDGAQAGGCLPPELEHVDFYVCTGYKWELAGFGVAAVIAREHTLRSLGIGTGPSFSSALTYGYINVPGICAFEAALDVRHSIGVTQIVDRTAELATRIHNGCVSLGLNPAAPLERTGTLVCLETGTDADMIAARLADQGICVAVRDSRIRISAYFYNTDADIEALLESLARLAPEISPDAYGKDVRGV
ncbi:aminotransferase class V-fold PLP-dependent enzyme [Streptomyces sp. NPDC001840]